MATVTPRDIAMLRLWADAQRDDARVAVTTLRAVCEAFVAQRQALRQARAAADRAHAELLARGIALPPDTETA